VESHFDREGASRRYIDAIEFESGIVIEVGPARFDDINVLSQVVTAGDDELHGTANADILDGKAGNDVIYGKDGNDIIFGGAGDDKLYGDGGNDVLFGDHGNDTLYGGDGDDYLSGGAGHDRLYGDAGDDILHGGAGDDYLSGGVGSDQYFFGMGDGLDVIDDRGSAADFDVVVFGPGILSQDVKAQRIGNDLHLIVREDEDEILVKDHFSRAGNRIAEVQFSDSGSESSVLTAADLDVIVATATDGADELHGDAQANVMYGLAGDDLLFGYGGNDTLYGGDGNDRLLGGDGDDVLYGEDGDDILEGGNGNDTLIGGLGNDLLIGGAGSDTYVVAADGSHDVIVEYDATGKDIDRVLFEEGITSEHLSFRRTTNDIVIDINKDGVLTTVTIQNGFINARNRVDYLEFSDGSTIDIDTVMANSAVWVGTAASETAYGHDGADTMDGGAGNDTLYGRAGNDILRGGDGNDSLYGEAGDDILHGDAGNDRLYGDAGDDILDGGAGNDRLYGGAGNDTYLFGKGDGQDIIYNDDASDRNNAESHDRLVFKEGVALEEVRTTRSGNNLVLSIAGTSDHVTVNNWFATGTASNKLQSIEFADGRSLDLAQVEIDVRTIHGTDGVNTLQGAETDDVLYGYGGNDTLRGGGGNDVLYGGEGNDYLYGDAGDDILIGGAGNDFLQGGAGSDTYIFGSNSGVDTINNYDTDSLSVDIARFDDAAIEDLWFSRTGNHLRITVAGTDDSVTVNNWYSGSNYQLDRIEVGSSVLLDTQVDQLVSAMSSFAVPSGAGNVIPSEVKDALHPVLAETWQTA
ncbi:MAG: calcium-binding protein, partial [Pseudomonas sp.]